MGYNISAHGSNRIHGLFVFHEGSILIQICSIVSHSLIIREEKGMVDYPIEVQDGL